MELYKHNKVTYDKVVDVLSKSRKVAIIQATGTGKSFITMKLFQDYFKGLKKLYIVPKNSIADSVQMYDEWDNTDVVFTTYQALQDLDDHTLYLYTKAFSVVLCDEFHHTGAPVWYRAIKVLADHARYFIGLSATSIRYLDGNRDMAKELFGDSVVYGPNLSEAIRDGILPKFQYISLLYDTRDFIEKASKQVNKDDTETASKIERLRLSEDGSYELGVRLRKYISPNNKKWIVFCNSIEHLQDVEIDIRNWFNTDDVNVYKLHSGLSRKSITSILSEFNATTKLSVIACVDMLNEGVHVEGVTGLIMLRKTNSLTVFLQQLGRALSASNKTITPQIIDVVENYDNMKTMVSACKQAERYVVDPNVTSVSGKEMFIVDDILLKAEDIIQGINSFKGSYEWEPWQDNMIIGNYPIAGPSMYYMIPGITKEQCTRRARELGVRYKRLWTEEEDLIIKRYYPTEGKEVYKRLENRTKDSCSSRASTLKVKYHGRWTIDCDIVLMTYYGIEKEECFKRLPEFTAEECRKQVIRLHL